MSTIIIDADTSRLEQKVVDSEARTLAAAQQQVALVNRVMEISFLTLGALGVAIDATFRLQIFALRTAINTVIQTRAALAISNPALAAATAAIGATEIFFLYSQIRAIESGQQQTTAQMQSLYSLARQSSAMGGVYL